MFLFYLYTYFILNLKKNKLFTIFIFNLIVILILIFTLKEPSKLFNYWNENIIWLNIFLSLILSLEDIFNKDQEKGILDLIKLMNISFDIMILYKSLIHWFYYFLPLIFFIKFIKIIIGVEIEINISFFTLVCGSLFLNSLGFIGTALILGFKQRLFILYIILFPLFIPYILFNAEFIYINYLNILSIIITLITPVIVTFILEKT